MNQQNPKRKMNGMKKVKEEFKRHHGNFGYRRITMVINRKYKKQYNEKRI
ncbi:IS3 family transposase, partial [Compostibacillus humi]